MHLSLYICYVPYIHSSTYTRTPHNHHTLYTHIYITTPRRASTQIVGFSPSSFDDNNDSNNRGVGEDRDGRDGGDGGDRADWGGSSSPSGNSTHNRAAPSSSGAGGGAEAGADMSFLPTLQRLLSATVVKNVDQEIDACLSKLAAIRCPLAPALTLTLTLTFALIYVYSSFNHLPTPIIYRFTYTFLPFYPLLPYLLTFIHQPICCTPYNIPTHPNLSTHTPGPSWSCTHTPSTRP